jgi:Flp pilus assembly protein TadG
MHTNLNKREQIGESGQTLILFTFFMIVLILFVGLGVDLGFAYITRARLSKAVDAACLTGVRAYNSSDEQGALNLAESVFRANYGTSGRDILPIADPIIKFGKANNNLTLDVSGTRTISTFFIRVLPTWSTLTVGSSAQATRPNLRMTLVLDTSGSMDPKRGPPPEGDGSGSGGGKYLPDAVTKFINNFDDQLDKVAMVKFAWQQTDVVFAGAPPSQQPKQQFKQDIIDAVNAFVWDGATFSQGGLTNGLVMENNVSVVPKEKIVKVVVFFTDGLANVVQATLNCSGAPTLRNFGGYDVGDTVGCFDPVSGPPELGGTGGGGALACCPSVTQFQSAIDGSMKDFFRMNVTADAEFRSIQVSDEMRADHIIVYSIGVGTGINQTFLKKIANDPSLAGTLGYAPTDFDGISIVANTGADLPAVFEKIADAILKRLSK